jgi:hypothetical protein
MSDLVATTNKAGPIRIRGNLCHVGGKFAPCDSAGSSSAVRRGVELSRQQAQAAGRRSALAQRRSGRGGGGKKGGSGKGKDPAKEAEQRARQEQRDRERAEDRATRAADREARITRQQQRDRERQQQATEGAAAKLRKELEKRQREQQQRRGGGGGSSNDKKREQERLAREAERQAQQRKREAEQRSRRSAQEQRRAVAEQRRRASQASRERARADEGRRREREQADRQQTQEARDAERVRQQADRQTERAQRRAEIERRQAEREERRQRQLADLAQRVEAGNKLSDSEWERLIVEGLAERRGAQLLLTGAGQQQARRQPRTTKARRTFKAVAPDRVLNAGHTGVMVALYPDDTAIAQLVAVQGVTEPAEQLHLTLCYLGDSTEAPLATNKPRLIEAIQEWAEGRFLHPLQGTINGLGRFFHAEEDSTNAVYVSPDVQGLPELRQSLVEWVERSGFDYAQNHGFTPHITVAYVPESAPTPDIRVDMPVTFGRVTLAWGDEQYDFEAAQGPSTFAVFKDARGQDRWLSITTTAYRDKDEEIISSGAITQAVRIGDVSGYRGPLRYWHVPGLDIGDCDFQTAVQDGRFLIESGTFRSKAYARMGRRMAARGYQMSPGFIHPWRQPVQRIYSDIAIFERSPVPPGRAANYLTRLMTKEDRMLTKEKETELRSLLGDEPELLGQLLAQVATTDKAAQTAGIAYKEAPEWAQALIARIEALETTTKAAQNATDAAPVVEAKQDELPPEMPEDEPMDDGPILGPADADLIAQAVVTVIGPMLEMEKKVAGYLGEMKSLVGGSTQKDDTRAQEIALLKQQQEQLNTRLKELEGDLPSAVLGQAGQIFRPSEVAQTIVPVQMAEKIKQASGGNGAPPDLTPAEAAAYSLIWPNG